MKERSTIREEIRRETPFRSEGEEILVALLRTAYLVQKRMERITAEFGLTLPQYNVLRTLEDSSGPLPTMEIAERLVVDAPGITRLLGSLDEAGLIHREHWPGDRRQILCALTKEGSRLLASLGTAMVEAAEDSTRLVSSRQRDQLIASLDSIRRCST